MIVLFRSFRFVSVFHVIVEGSMERRLRSLAIDWLNQLRQNPTLLPVKSRYLLNRSSRHFKHGDFRSVNAWHSRKRKNPGFSYLIPSLYQKLFLKYESELSTELKSSDIYLR